MDELKAKLEAVSEEKERLNREVQEARKASFELWSLVDGNSLGSNKKPTDFALIAKECISYIQNTTLLQEEEMKKVKDELLKSHHKYEVGVMCCV